MRKDFEIYTLLELSYKDKHKDIDENEIFPNNWYSSHNYDLKIRVLMESLDKGILIEETDLYNEEFNNDLKQK